MPALAFADAAVKPPAFAFAGDSSHPLPVHFSGVPPAVASGISAESSYWSPACSDSLYKINGWGAPYFTVNSSGNISVRPHGTDTLPHQDIDLLKIVKKASDPKSSGGLGLQLPLIVRFPDVLKNRLESLQTAFDLAIQSQDYRSRYQGVYPVKCNQDRFVVEDVVRFGFPFRFGLEAGSKPELLLAMSCLCRGNPDALLICNGFKDAEYISLALVARKLALNTVIVLEQEEELGLVVALARELSVRPVIGLRAKLRTKHSGHFGSTSGEKGKFGLTTVQILRVVSKLEEADMLDCLQLLHFHIGSQIPTTDLLNGGISEAAHIYCELVRLGAHMKVIDIGGGLGIDYDGSKSGDSDISVAYGLEEYAAAVVGAVRVACDRKSVNHPVICSESGRALVSHHSVLIFEAVCAGVLNTPALHPPAVPHLLEGLPEDCLADYRNLVLAGIQGEYETCLIYADLLKQRCVEEFKEGSLDMEQLAAVDSVCDLVSDPIRTYHVNLSVFTSVPDFWGIGQLFPIVPIHRLDQRPAARGVLSDLTCDSDGKMNKFIGGDSSLPLHEMESEVGWASGGGGFGGYYLGMFLGGAYEEALGGVHNLFGGPSVVRVLQSDGYHGFAVTSAVAGPSCGDVLRVMRHEPELMFETLKHRAAECYGEEDDGEGVAGLASGLARSFNSMPYLRDGTPSRCAEATAGNGAGGGNGYYCCGAATGGGEEDQWPFCYA